MSRLSVIIPFRDNSNITIDCINSLNKYAWEEIFEIILISNNSIYKELNRVRHAIGSFNKVKIFEYNRPFNYQKINNWGANKTKGDTLLFLNNDTEFVSKSKGLLKEMIRKSKESQAGAVGCLLLYGDGENIQHAGVFLKPNNMADHLFIRKKYNSFRFNDNYPLDESREVTAVTGAALIVNKKKFDKVGGFDEEFVICGGDVDLCIRMNNIGFQSWYVSGGKYILHKEKMTRANNKIPYIDYVKSYRSYITAYDFDKGDKFLPFAMTNEEK